ncbi:TVP38/TMEM64 family protein [Jannaschia aquimarina]|uniref:TVP38/TMEM64 family membrane protein n=1 Tax=Jannaschia aquimarina TaxID=935700 RepID=A0A0D1CKH7_9RHOB|nr:VTT domain-containing protein [Jannaschia aquimarina]KIT15252.1 TVP38/TMEM64 family inner membrane protein YdjZ [Jannaschia aquimarina]SNT32234.1 Uncharacterized membrane protein YdjX, TVP38/TMEM64 family, SNARE-associated domain [Jannaschia aquimarina]
MRRRLPSWKLWLWPVLFVGLGIVIWLLPWRGYVEPMRIWIAGQGATGWVSFVAIYTIVVMLPLPAAAMSVVGGLVFGWWGFPLSMLGSILGALPPWWLTHTYFRAPVLRRIGGKQAEAADRAVRENPALFILLLRFTPILPFTLQNYLLGLTGVRAWPYIWATLVGLAPGTVAMVWIGTVGGLAAAGADKDAIAYAIIGLILFGSLIIWMSGKAVRKLREAGFEIGR